MTRYRAHFRPEAWIRDQAVEIDADGPQDWNCTAFALAHPDYLAELAAWAEQDGLDAEWGTVDRWDYFKQDPEAPEQVRLHRGPFTITIFKEDA